MISQPTAKKLNAISVAISLMEDSNVSVAHFEINDLSIDEVKQIAKDRKVILVPPNHFIPYFRTVIKKGVHSLTIRSLHINTSEKAQLEEKQLNISNF